MGKKILAGLLVIIGLLLVFSNQISDYYIKLKSRDLTNVSLKINAQGIVSNLSKAASNTANIYDFSQVRPIGINASLDELLKARGNNTELVEDYIIGVLKVPDIDMDIAILKGVVNDNLLLGCGTVREDQEMGKGNYTLAGHLNRHDGVLFNRVPSIQNGALMYITDKQKIYVYKVFNQVTVSETRVDMIDDQISLERAKPVLQLMTCYLNGESGQRVFVQGELVEVRDYTDAAFNSLSQGE